MNEYLTLARCTLVNKSDEAPDLMVFIIKCVASCLCSLLLWAVLSDPAMHICMHIIFSLWANISQTTRAEGLIRLFVF